VVLKSEPNNSHFQSAEMRDREKSERAYIDIKQGGPNRRGGYRGNKGRVSREQKAGIGGAEDEGAVRLA
jgi:hypothetical protein